MKSSSHFAQVRLHFISSTVLHLEKCKIQNVFQTVTVIYSLLFEEWMVGIFFYCDWVCFNSFILNFTRIWLIQCIEKIPNLPEKVKWSDIWQYQMLITQTQNYVTYSGVSSKTQFHLYMEWCRTLSGILLGWVSVWTRMRHVIYNITHEMGDLSFFFVPSIRRIKAMAIPGFNFSNKTLTIGNIQSRNGRDLMPRE